MDGNVLIDKHTFEIYKDHPDVFICDYKIAPALAILNQKGYKTLASCSGHENRLRARVQENIDLDFLEETKKDSRFIITKINNNSFEAIAYDQFTSIYIMFENVKDLPNIPEGFTKDDKSIKHLVMYYDNDGKRYSSEYIESEINKYNNKLIEWANKLPLIERKDDKNE